jgi:hypothetical protein
MVETARLWYLALGHTMSAVCARGGADGVKSGYCDGLAWSQRTHGVVLQLLEVVSWTEQRSLGEPRDMTGSAGAPYLRGDVRAGSARRWLPRHAFDSGSLASGAACSRTSSPSGRL